MAKNYTTLYIILISCLFSSFHHIQAQTLFDDENSIQEDSLQSKNIFKKLYNYFEDSNKTKENKKFDISFIGGPSYSIDTKFGVGIVASGLYHLDKTNPELPPSNVSLYTNLTTSGFFAIGLEGNNIFKNDDYRIIYDLGFALMPSKFWGIGYSFGNQEEDFTKYKEYRFNLKVDGLRKVAKNTYVGLTITAQNIQGKDFENWDYIENEDPNNTAVGGGFIVSYDSRDFIPNAYKGIYIKVEQNFFPRHLGSNRNFTRFDFTTRYYKQAWKGAVLAFDFNATLNNGDVPWSMLALVGGSNQMRGYFKGQYRDKKYINSQIELRQKVYNRSGIAVWAGAGNAFPNFKSYEWSETLPTFGVGYRWEFKNRINVRLDYGIGKGQGGFYFNINESF